LLPYKKITFLNISFTFEYFLENLNRLKKFSSPPFLHLSVKVIPKKKNLEVAFGLSIINESNVGLECCFSLASKKIIWCKKILLWFFFRQWKWIRRKVRKNPKFFFSVHFLNIECDWLALVFESIITHICDKCELSTWARFMVRRRTSKIDS